MINVAILGYGTVGSGVFEILDTNKKLIGEKAGQEINVKYVLDLRDFPGDPCESVLVHDFNTILEDDEVEIAVQINGKTKGVVSIAKDASKEDALAAGKAAIADKLTGNVIKEIYVPGKIINIVMK